MINIMFLILFTRYATYLLPFSNNKFNNTTKKPPTPVLYRWSHDSIASEIWCVMDLLGVV